MDELALSLVVLGVLEHSALETAGGTDVPKEVIVELVGHNLFDLLDRGNHLGPVASSSAVVKAHTVGRIGVLDDFFNFLLLH